MMEKVYSIITPSTHDRKHFLDRIIACLAPQIDCNVEHIILVDGGEMSLGRKMNLLYGMVSGKYVGVVNDDDMVPDNYIELILEAAKSDADVLHGQLLSGWTQGLVSIEDFKGQVVESFENVMPAKTELVREYTVWDENPKRAYEQDSGMAKNVRDNAKSVHHIDQVLYYHMRQK